VITFDSNAHPVASFSSVDRAGDGVRRWADAGPNGNHLAHRIQDGADLRLRVLAKPLIRIVIQLPIEPDGSVTICHAVKHGNARPLERNHRSLDDLVGAGEQRRR
jgi:hypothetical protein